MNKPFSEVMSVAIPQDMAIALRRAAKKYDETESAIARLAISDWLVKEAQERE